MAVEQNKITDKLKAIVYAFDENSSIAKKSILTEISKMTFTKHTDILKYHEALLFLLVYPEDDEQQKLALDEMLRLIERVKNLMDTKKEKFDLSGLAFTNTHGGFSISLIKWLLNEFPGQVSIHSFDEEGIHPKEILKHVLGEMEFEIAADEKLKPKAWLVKVSGTKNKTKLLQWLIKHLCKLNAGDLIKDQLMDSMKLYVTICPKENNFSRSFGKISLTKTYFHENGLLKKFDERALINKKLPQPKKLSLQQRSEIIKFSRVALCLLNRETDPITYCNEDGLLYYELEHGLSIALFSMLPERRLPLESYIGFMMFKNGYPMAYGGGWLFGKRSLLGINIFEAFRGGESAFVFAQLLRTYKNAFGATYFEVEPYQFGKDNPEGIQSGAFWFYYRFGFRPVDEKLNQLANSEFQKIQSDKKYRSDFTTLKQFTKSNVSVNFSGNQKPINPSDISKYISQQIVKQFNGDREAVEKWCNAKLKKELGINLSLKNPGIKKLNLFYGLCLKTDKLSAKEKTKLKNFILEKGKDEFTYIKLCNEINLNSLFINKPNA
jgi:hypothetical protein